MTLDLILIAVMLLLIGCLIGLAIGIKILAQPDQPERPLTKSEALSRLPGLIEQGLTNVEIGIALGRHERTVRKYKSELSKTTYGSVE